tara:strand:+ start:1122 stop:1481 length:360 start_codon:yes stop_codon:yes gene_type:complete
MVKIADTFYFYRTDKTNEYINRDGNVIYRFDKITDSEVFFNDSSLNKFELNEWSCIHPLKQPKNIKIIKKCNDRNLFVIHYKERDSLFTSKCNIYKIIFHNNPYIFYKQNYNEALYDDI